MSSHNATDWGGVNSPQEQPRIAEGEEWRYPIVRGDTVYVIDAYGHELERRALTGVVDGRDFRVVWVCRHETWDATLPFPPASGIPWPVEHVSASRRSPALLPPRAVAGAEDSR